MEHHFLNIENFSTLCQVINETIVVFLKLNFKWGMFLAIFVLIFLSFITLKLLKILIPTMNFYVRNHENVESKLFKLILN